MIKTFSYSDENNEFLDMEQNNYFFEGEDCKVLYFSADKNEIYEPNLLVKLPFQYNKFLIDLYSDFSSIVNIFTIKKFQRMECDLYVDRVWRMNDKFYMKWKCKIIHMI